MRNRSLNRLSAAKVKALKEPGVYLDGGGLRLHVDAQGRKSWDVQITLNSKRTTRRLGSLNDVSLEQARIQATAVRSGAKQGIDTRAEEKLKAAGLTFAQVFERHFELREKQITSEKAAAQWRSTLETYAFPFIGQRPVAAITTSEIINLLKPIWFDKPETAMRVLQRVKTTFEDAIIHGDRILANPCSGVSGHLGRGHQAVEHHRSMPWAEVPAFIKFLRTPSPRRHPVTALCFEFLVLTAGRSGEVRGACWSEVSIEAATWVIPKERMKARVEHRVPLPPRCLEVLTEAKLYSADSPLVFPSSRTGEQLSDMTLVKLLRDAKLPFVPHGFRSSFKEWAAKVAKVPDEVSEAALAHADKNRVRAAYLRTDFFDERRALMQAWADYVSSGLIQAT